MKKPIAVVGAGLVGRGWAIVFARAGHPVNIFDVTEEKISEALQTIENNLADLASHGLISNPNEIRERITGTTDLADAVREVIWVQECVFEKVETKKEIFRALDEIAPGDAILASSTSTFPGSAFTVDLRGRHRALVAHPPVPIPGRLYHSRCAKAAVGKRYRRHRQHRSRRAKPVSARADLGS